MNYQSKIMAKRAFKSLIQANYPEGCIKITSGSSYLHEVVKAEVGYYLKANGWDVYTECTFKGYGRADIVALHSSGRCVILEILCSETNKQFKEKLEKYPNLEIIKVKAKEFDYETFSI